MLVRVIRNFYCFWGLFPRRQFFQTRL
uniref:Uncharacterized protein n=1 Tax=Rhizophora mucronata TaxID=61149 RepID=A0A2P2PH08_RHIMU